jgi:hypothetical protein
VHQEEAVACIGHRATSQSEFHDTPWLTRFGAPRFYPDAETLTGVKSAPAQIQTIAALVGSTREKEWAVKDSFQAWN